MPACRLEAGATQRGGPGSLPPPPARSGHGRAFFVNHVVGLGQVARGFDRAQGVIAGHHQHHVRGIERVLRGQQQGLALRGVGFVLDAEGGAAIIEADLSGPGGQRGIGLRAGR